MNRLNLGDFKKYFENKNFIETTDIADFCGSFEKQKKSITIHWCIFHWCKKYFTARSNN